MKITTLILIALTSLLTGCGETKKEIVIGYIEGLSGPFANVGEMGLRHLELEVDAVNQRGDLPEGMRLKVAPFDNKTNPQEALLAFRSALDAGVDYVFQGNSSSVALALSDAIGKHNQRNPDRQVLFLNYAAVDPALTNDRCDKSHFRFDADVDMKISALTDYMASREDIKSVYLINQDYSFGQAVSRAARSMLQEKRPDIKIVGDDLHPIGKVKDFSPYIAKIKSSGAKAVLTGNWGNDMTLLIKSAKQMGADVDFYTFYAGAAGGVTVIGESGIDRVYQITTWHSNANADTKSNARTYADRYPDAPESLYYSSIRRAVRMLEKALIETGSSDVDGIRSSLSSMTFTDDTGPISIRPDNHQLLQPLYLSKLISVEGISDMVDVEKTGLGFETIVEIPAENTRLDTTCQF